MASPGTEQPSVVIRGGTIVDGTGAPPYVADIAISGKVISSIGKDLPVRGVREVDARGMLVTPGWVDAHTHMDAQVTWDPHCSPCTANGVTTLVMGNCGIGIAPCPADLRDFLMSLCDTVEDIPHEVLRSTIQWDWETMPEFLAAMAQRPLACDVGFLVGHAPIRTWVMGERASLSDRPGGPQNDPVSDEEIAQMAKVVEEAVAAGALGFSTSRQLAHRDLNGVLMPGSIASVKEVLALGNAIVQGGGGCLQFADDFGSYDDVPPEKRDPAKFREHQRGEWRWIEQLATENPDTLVLTTAVGLGMGPESARDAHYFFRKFEKIAAKGGQVVGQCMIRMGGLHFSLASGIHPFVVSPTFERLRAEAAGSMETLSVQMAEPTNRDTILAETRAAVKAGTHRDMGAVGVVMGDSRMTWPWSPTYEPRPEDSIQERAGREGRGKLDLVYDLLVDLSGPHGGVLWRALYNYGPRDGEPIREILTNKHCVPGFADAGAHLKMVCDASAPTYLLTHWARDRTRGPRLPLELVVRKHTAETAALFGLTDRGELLPGKKADLNIIDHAALKILPPHWETDLPLGVGRWLQEVEGYRLTMVSGQAIFEDGVATGELPGSLVRNPRSVGLKGSLKGTVPPVGSGDKLTALDLTEHALSISGGIAGQSAAGRVLKGVPTHAEPQSKL